MIAKLYQVMIDSQVSHRGFYSVVGTFKSRRMSACPPFDILVISGTD